MALVTTSAAVTVKAAAAAAAVKTVLTPLVKAISAELSEFTSQQWLRFTNSFTRYLGSAEHRHKFFSSQVFANQGQLLEQYYVPLTLQKAHSATGANIVVSGYPTDLFNAYRDVLIVDTAGMGKSTLLKFIFLQAIKTSTTIPVFVELRKLSGERSLQRGAGSVPASGHF